VANASGFGRAFTRFALVLFPILLFLGITTYIRLVRINLNDAYIVAAMNRLRRAYVDVAPEIAPYLTSGTSDDVAGLYDSILLGQPRPKSPWPHILVTTPTALLVLNAIIGAAGAAFFMARAKAGDAWTAIVAIVVAVVIFGSLGAVQKRAAGEMVTRPARFPAPTGP
jgi:hypothetical protein